MKSLLIIVASISLLCSQSWAAPAKKARTAGPAKPPIPEVARAEAICFAYYTVNRGVLKLTAQLYPLKDGDSRAAVLETKDGDQWVTVAKTQVTEEPYNNYRNDKTWTAHFRVSNWDESRTVPYRVTALDGIAAYEGTIRANPVGKQEIVVAAFTGNSNQDRRLKPDLIANLKAQDPDLLFFSGDQSYDHVDHLGAWLLFGRQFGEIIKDRPMVSIPDDHDVGHANLWGAGGKKSSSSAGDDGGYFMPVEYVKAVERAQTWHLPDPVDPERIDRGIGVYFTSLNWGGISFAIIEDRKFKTGPNGPLQLKPEFSPRPDWVTNSNYDPKSLDVAGAELLGRRQENFLEQWGQDWTGADFKVVLSQTIFSYATHVSHGNRLLADLDSNGWPQSGRRRAVDLMRRCFAFHICGDQHLGCIAQYGLDDWRDSSVAFCVPSIVNYYPRKWLPLDAPAKAIDGLLPNIGDYTEGFGNKLTVYAYANPVAFPAPVNRLSESASGHGLVRFDRETRRITIECWPRGVDVTQPGAKQFTGWPLSFRQEDNYGRAASAWLPRLVCNVDNPVVQVVDEQNKEVLYTLRIRGREFSPRVFRAGTYTVRVGEGPGRREFKGLQAVRDKDAAKLEVNLPRLNVLLIISDDLRDTLACYGNPVIKTPNFDRLAARGVRFNRAYAQYPVCNPSRVSFMTGLRCEQTRVVHNSTMFRTRLPDILTMPQLLRGRGWHAASYGKIFHVGEGAGEVRAGWTDVGRSWDEALLFQPTPAGEVGKVRNLTGGKLKWCDVGAMEGTDDDQPDGQNAVHAIRAIEQQTSAGKPWFIGAGFHRPHDPFLVPKKYYDMYTPSSLKLYRDPANITPVPRLSMPGGAFKEAFDAFTDEDRLEFLRGYYAGVSFTDAQVGRLLDTLDRLKLWDNTIVIFAGDNGYHHNERNWWNKDTLFERSCRVPLIIATPDAKGGQVSQALVELVDLYPTIVDYSGHKPPHGLAGSTLRPLLNDPSSPGKKAAFTFVARGEKNYGQSVRTDRWRYTRWSDGSAELYDHQHDPEETRDLARDAAHAGTIHELASLLDGLGPVRF